MNGVAEFSGAIAGLAGWLATYAVHSAILLGLAALIAPRLRRDAWGETLWRTALLGALFTTTIQAAIGYTPVVGRWTIEQPIERPSPVAGSSAETVEREADPAPARTTEEAAQQGAPGSPGGEESVAAEVAVPPASAGRASEHDDTFLSIGLAGFLVSAWILVALGLLGRVGWRQVRLFRLLRGRRPIREGPLAEMLAELRRNAGIWQSVRLSTSPICHTPVAFGWSEVCVPERFVGDLEPEQQRSALAHELAHLARRDPAWELLAGIVEALLFFQPLNRLARLRLRDAAENLCDDWAVRQTGSPLSLARCLTDIASWVGARPELLPNGTMAMAEGGSPLLHRVRRLTQSEKAAPRPSRLRFAGAVALVGLIATAAPAISLVAPEAGSRGDSEEILGSPGASTVDVVREPPEGRSRAVPPESVFGPDTVIFHPNPSAPLVERWQWALARDLPGGFWIAWGVQGAIGETVVGGGRTVVVGGREVSGISSNSTGAPDVRGVRSLKEILPGAGEQVANVAFLFGFAGGGNRSGQLDWIRLRSADVPLDLAGRPIIWLGRANTRESVAQLRRIYGSIEAPELKAEIAAALTLHEGQEEVLRAVLDLLDAEDDPDVRAEPVQWLPRTYPGTEPVVNALLTVAFEDPAAAVRLEAVDAIANLDSEEARRALVRIVETHPQMQARSEAAQALARQSQ